MKNPLRYFSGLKWRALSRLFAVAASLLSLSLYALHPQLLESLDQRSRDLVFKLREAPAPSSEVVVVAVDEKSIKTFGRWPWPRDLQAELISRLKIQGAGVIALDIIYLQPESEHMDQFMETALARPGPPVIGGYFFRNDQSRAINTGAEVYLKKQKIGIMQAGAEAKTDTIPAFSQVEHNQAALARHMQGLGFFNFIPLGDGLVRDVPMVLQYDKNYYPSLSLMALSKYLQESIALGLDEEGVSYLRVGKKQIAVDEYARLSLNFYNGQHRIPIISALDVIQGTVGSGELAGKIVFVGVTELGLSDLRATPVDPRFPGVAVHATAVSNVLQSFYLYQDKRTVLIDVLLMALVPLIMVIAIAQARKPILMLLGFASALTIVWLVFYWCVAVQGLLISFIYPALAIVIGYMMFQSYYVLVAQRHTRFLRNAFSTYVSPDLVDRIITTPEQLALSGEKRVISVLFSDIRGFTTLSESLEPEKLTRILNEYLAPMTDIVMSNQGTLDKYIGDAIMCLFNAPLDVKNHEHKAATAARQMLQTLSILNQEFMEKYQLKLEIGIGIHTGAAVVGNLGSPQRFDYTAIGDTVNLASRLEGRTKAYGVRCIISDVTYAALKDVMPCRHLDRIRVKGKTQPVDIYELLADDQEHAEDKIKSFHQALEYYFEGNFSAALRSFEEFLVDYPGDGPARVFQQRCQDFLNTVPAENWDGVYIAREK